MKRGFSLLELIFVLIILGILATIAVEILLKVAQNYTISRAVNTLNFKTDLILNELGSKLEGRIKNSVIATECNATKNECIKGDVSDFISINELSEENADKYPVLEWINFSIFSKRGEWSDSAKRVIPGWSGFVDLKKTEKNDNDDYNITIPYSKMSTIQVIDGNWSERWGISGYNDVFSNQIDVLIFSGPLGRGAFNDINHSYGWYKNLYADNKAQKVFKIIDIINDDLKNTKIRVKTVDDTNDTTAYEGFFIVNSAFAVVPSYNVDTKDYNLTLFQNYYPWKKQMYTDGNASLLAIHVTQFKFKEQNGLLRLYICIQDPSVHINKNENLTVCKERIVF